MRGRMRCVDLALTCPTCSWIFTAEVEVAVPTHADYLLSRSCQGIGAGVSCIDVRPEWKRALAEGQGALGQDEALGF